MAGRVFAITGASGVLGFAVARAAAARATAEPSTPNAPVIA